MHGHTGDGFCIRTALLSNMYGIDIMLTVPRLYRLLPQQQHGSCLLT